MLFLWCTVISTALFCLPYSITWNKGQIAQNYNILLLHPFMGEVLFDKKQYKQVLLDKKQYLQVYSQWLNLIKQHVLKWKKIHLQFNFQVWWQSSRQRIQVYGSDIWLWLQEIIYYNFVQFDLCLTNWGCQNIYCACSQLKKYTLLISNVISLQ